MLLRRLYLKPRLKLLMILMNNRLQQSNVFKVLNLIPLKLISLLLINSIKLNLIGLKPLKQMTPSKKY